MTTQRGIGYENPIPKSVRTEQKLIICDKSNQIRPAKLVTSLICMFWPHVHPHNAILGHSLYDLVKEVGNEIIYILAYSIYTVSTIV